MKKKISELKDESEENIQTKRRKKCKKQNSTQNLWDMYNENINIHVIEISIEE